MVSALQFYGLLDQQECFLLVVGDMNHILSLHLIINYLAPIEIVYILSNNFHTYTFLLSFYPSLHVTKVHFNPIATALGVYSAYA